jgi:hypothetical protein
MSRLKTVMKCRQITYRGIGDRVARGGGPLKPAKEAAHAAAAGVSKVHPSPALIERHREAFQNSASDNSVISCITERALFAMLNPTMRVASAHASSLNERTCQSQVRS